MRLSKISQWFPITLLAFYILLLTLIDTELYASVYSTIVTRVDTALMCFTIIGAALFIKKWRLLAIVSFVTVILLNILTELNFRITIEYYYEFYILIIALFFITMFLFSTLKK